MKSEKRNPWLWVPSLYLAEGVPYVIVMVVASVMYARLGLSNAQIALYTSWLYLPWVIKPFWSPVVDLWRTKKWWIVTMQMFIGAALGGLAFSLQVPSFVQWSLAFLWLMAFCSATHDIAADGFYLIALTPKDQALFVGIRSTFYRIASIIGQGLLIMVAGALEAMLRPAQAWGITFAVCAGVFLLFFIYHARFLPSTPADCRSGASEGDNEEEDELYECAYCDTRKSGFFTSVFQGFVPTIVSFFQKPHIHAALLFMLLYRLPEALLVKISPLFLLDTEEHGGLGLATGDLGMVQGTVGVIGLTLGGILGGIAAERGGLRKWLWPMVLSITVPDAFYILLSYFQPDNLVFIGTCIFFEQFGYGFGFTAYMLYLILFAKGTSSTAHYAFCTGFMALGMMLPGMFAGYLQETIGYLNFFIVATALCAVTFLVSALIKIDTDFCEGGEGEVL